MNKYITFSIIIFSFLFLSPTAKSQSLLWEISGNGLEESSYLFGTIHIADQRVFNFNDSVFAKIDECDAFAMEIEMTLENSLKVEKMIYLEEGKTLSQFYSKEDYNIIKAFFKDELQLDIANFENMHPFAISATISFSGINEEMELSVDEYLYQYAKDQNKKTYSVEPFEVQMKIFKAENPNQVIRQIKKFKEDRLLLEEMIQIYDQEDLTKVAKLISEDTTNASMQNALLWDRNISMADTIELMVNRQSTFIAIGTAHLPLEDGVIDLLIKKGFSVKPIIAPKTKQLPLLKKPTWEVIEPEEAGFSIEMPTQPTAQEINQPSPIGDLKIKMLMCEAPNDENNNFYITAITDYPSESVDSRNMTPAEISALYDRVIDGGITNVNGVLIKNGETRLDTFLVKTADVKTQDGTLNVRFATLLINNRIYMLQVLTENSLDNNKGLERFFKSFKLKNYSSKEIYKPKEKIVNEWNILESKEGNFSMMMFGKPKMTTNTIETEYGKTTLNFYMTDIFDSLNNELIYFVQYSDFPEEHTSDSMSTERLIEFYDASLYKPLENGKGELISKKMVEIDGERAQKSQYFIFQGDIKVKVHALRLLYKNRLYFLQYGTVGKEATQEEVDYFLNSFKILNK